MSCGTFLCEAFHICCVHEEVPPWFNVSALSKKCLTFTAQPDERGEKSEVDNGHGNWGFTP